MSPPIARLPWVGLTGVFLGAIISTLSGRLTTFGLADVRGAIGAGIDDGAWITTAGTVGQMVIAFPAVWLGAAFGARRVLLWGAGVFMVSQTVLPLSTGLPGVLVWQAIGGLAAGTFIPLTIGFVLRNLPPSLATFGIAAYGMNSELSQNIAATLEGWFVDHLSWRWIYWDTALIAPLMMLCVWFGTPREPVNRAVLSSADPWGMIFASTGFGLLYAGLDQGNRLDWLNSGLICGLLLGGAILVLAFVIHELRNPSPAISLGFLVHGNIPLLGAMLLLFRLIVLSTAYLIPQYLTTIQGFRALETGDVLLLIALPQLVLAPIVGALLLVIDGRFLMGLGFALIGAACFMAGQLTSVWANGDFLPSQVLQALGQSLGLTSVVWFATRHLTPAQALTFGAFLQTARLLGGELGIAFMQTFVRVREQLHSFLLGLHIDGGSAMTALRLQAYASADIARSVGPADANARATGQLAHAVWTQANVMAFADGFNLLGMLVIVSLLLMVLLQPPPATASMPKRMLTTKAE